MKFTYHKETKTWDIKIKGVKITLTQKEIENFYRNMGIELLEADPGWHKYLEEYHGKK